MNPWICIPSIHKETKMGYCVVWHYFWGVMNKCPLTSDRDPKTDQSTNLTKVQLGDQWLLLALLTFLWEIPGRAYLQEQKWLKNTCLTKPLSRMGDNSQSWEPVAHCSACTRLQSVLPKKFSQSEPSPGNPACLSLLYRAQPVSKHFLVVLTAWGGGDLCI